MYFVKKNNERRPVDNYGSRRCAENLTLSVNQEEEKEEKEQRFIRKERSRFSYSRSYYLDKACEEKIKAKMDNGILTITVGKAEEEIKKSISID